MVAAMQTGVLLREILFRVLPVSKQIFMVFPVDNPKIGKLFAQIVLF